MSDRELNELLRRYRPAAPPPDLRDRITVPIAARRTWPWSVAAAALLIATCALQWSTERIYRAVENFVAPGTGVPLTLDRLPAWREALGDDELMRSAVEGLARQEQELPDAARASAIDTGASWP